MGRTVWRALIVACVCLCVESSQSAEEAGPRAPVALIFDTDMGNDIDDALALGVIHALESRGECRLLAVTLSKANTYSAMFVDLINTFYGRGQIPIGKMSEGPTPDDGKYTRRTVESQQEGMPRYRRWHGSIEEFPHAVPLLRRTLAAQPDGSVVMVVVGFSTNLARLLDTPADEYSPLSGRELVAKKVRLLSTMAGMYSATGRHKEYNVHVDLESARRVYADWPTPIVASGFEVGLAIKYPATSIEQDYGYVAQHPLAEAYSYYMQMPYDRETWDLTSVLYAVRPERGYFDLSPPGTVHVDDQQVTQFTPAAEGRHRYLIVSPEQIARVREALVQLASQPPDRTE
jgi:inosine-uridine nucleoside N-ribohydrolase